MRLYTHPKLIISLEEINGVKYFKEIWSGIINTVVFRDLIRKTLTIYRKEIPKLNNTTTKLLIISDSREIELIRKEDIDWLNEEINPIYHELGITHQALIPPTTILLNDLIDLYTSDSEEEKFLNLPFKNEEEGLKWFLEQIKKD